MRPVGAVRTADSTGSEGRGRKKVLVVDDDKVIIKALSNALRAKGYEALASLDGSEAIRLVRQEQPDLILLDIHFPPDVGHGGGVAWDGFLILSWLRRMDEAKDTPVVIMSRADPAQYQERCRALGVVEFLQKPVDLEKLLTVLGQVLAEPLQGGEQFAPAE